MWVGSFSMDKIFNNEPFNRNLMKMLQMAH